MRRITFKIIEVTDNDVTAYISCKREYEEKPCRSSMFKIHKDCLPTILSVFAAGTEKLNIDLSIKMPDTMIKEFGKNYTFDIKEDSK